MKKPKLIKGLSDICDRYNTFLIDLWGVLHDGIHLNPDSIKVLNHLEEKKKKIVLMTNAPRPAKSVGKFLETLGLDKKYFKYIFTSGDAALKTLRSNKYGKFFYHIGATRDKDLIQEFLSREKKIDNCDFILCTGLFDQYDQSLDYYKKLLKKKINLKMICTNPDLIIHRGGTKEYCAGSIAKLFNEMGGNVVYFGKPYKEIYNLCIEENDKILVIGDNLKTDIKGANNMSFDSLFITSGVHANEILNNKSDISKILKENFVTTNFIQNNLRW